MNSILINILAGCATQAVISIFLWHRGLLGLPARVERIESNIDRIKQDLQGLPARVEHIESGIGDIKQEMREMRLEHKADMRELRDLCLRLNERIDKLFIKS